MHNAKCKPLSSTDEMLESALKARDSEVKRIQSLSKTQQDSYTTVVGAVDLDTGKVAVGAKNSKIHRGQPICSEDLAVSQLGGNKSSIVMTPAIRPRTNEAIPVCKRCQAKYSKNQFMKGTTFQ